MNFKMSCPICLEYLHEPQVFNCGHTFCIRCTLKILKQSEHILATPVCPTCKKYIKYISKNYILNNVLDSLSTIIGNNNSINNNDLEDKKSLYIELDNLCEQKLPFYALDKGKQLIINDQGTFTWVS